MTPLDWHLSGAAIGGLLCGISGLLSFWLALKLLKRGPVGPLLAMVLGLALRSIMGLGGAAIGFTLLNGWNAEEGEKIAFWMWVLAAYIVSLVIESVLLVRRLPRSKPAVETGKG